MLPLSIAGFEKLNSVDALEYLRQLFAAGCIQSGFFHRFTGTDHDAMGRALNKALYNYMHGIGLDEDVRSWFEGQVPKTTVSPRFIERALVEGA